MSTSTTIDITQLAQWGEELVRRAGALAKSYSDQRNFEINYKGVRDIVTTADLAVDKLVREAINTHYPTHAILSEEFEQTILSDKEKLLGPLWVIDPIDGTTNFTRGVPMYSVAVAFADKGIVEWGAVFAPEINEFYTAQRGKGAFCNGKPIVARKTTDLVDTLVATGFPYNRITAPVLAKRVLAIITNCKDLRRCGAASIDTCWVARGRFDAYYESVKPWDIAAAGLIAREAGAKVGKFRPPDSDAWLPDEIDGREFIAASPGIYDKVSTLLRDA